MITNYQVGAFSYQDIYSPINIEIFVIEGASVTPPVITVLQYHAVKRGQAGHVAKGRLGTGGMHG